MVATKFFTLQAIIGALFTYGMFQNSRAIGVEPYPKSSINLTIHDKKYEDQKKPETLHSLKKTRPPEKTGEDSMATPKYLYKIFSSSDWEQSQKDKNLPTAAEDHPFIHLATFEQLDRIINKYWSGKSDFVILEIETKKLPGDLVFEANPGGENKYYHLYNASIPTDAISTILNYEKP